MKLFNLFSSKNHKEKNNNQKQNVSIPYLPHSFYQDSRNSIVSADGRYDFERFSEEEEAKILSVLNTVKDKFPPQYYSIGLILESYGIIYKPRYILFELIVLKYKNSLEPMEQFVVGLAYSNKGAPYRKDAIEYIEKSIDKISDECFIILSHVYPLWSVYNTLSVLCEKELMFEKAIKYAKLSSKLKPEPLPYDYIRLGKIYLKIDIDLCIKYYEAILNEPLPASYKDAILIELNEAEEKQKRGYKYKPRHRNQKDDLEEKIREAALRYINYI